MTTATPAQPDATVDRKPPRILVVDDERSMRELLAIVLRREGYEVLLAENGKSAIATLEREPVDILISDIKMPDLSGVEVLRAAKRIDQDILGIMITAFASTDTAVEAMRLGACDYLSKPFDVDLLRMKVREKIESRQLRQENVLLKREIGKDYDFSSIIGESPALNAILDEVRKVADAKSSVLLLGETGTGKELFARVIHHNSPRRNMPFVPINCSAIPESLLETELFGHVRGAFTGAVATKKGILDEAEGGTVFLDEIGDMSLSLQAKLLRVIEDQVIRPVGSTKGSKVDIRFITATNKDLKAAVRQNAFREDLYYRINVISLQIPPLRERKEDIKALVTHYLEKYSHEMGRSVKELSPESLELLMNYEWAGNVRELQNVIERAILVSDGNVITPEHLPVGMKGPSSFEAQVFDKKLSIEEYTKAFIQRYQGQFNEQQLADMLWITRKSLWEKRKKWGIPRGR